MNNNKIIQKHKETNFTIQYLKNKEDEKKVKCKQVKQPILNNIQITKQKQQSLRLISIFI